MFAASVTDTGCFSPNPGSWFLSIPDPASKNSNKKLKKGGEKTSCPIFCSHKYDKIKDLFIFE